MSVSAHSTSFHDCTALTFALGRGRYAIPAAMVLEIIKFQTPTRLPGSARDILGMLNLRGHVAPIMCLRRRLNLADADMDADAESERAIIIVDHPSGHVGLVVDAMHEVMDIPATDQRPPLDQGEAVDLHFISAMSDRYEHLIMLLDIEAIVEAH